LIYETMGLRTVFKGGVVNGKFNVDLTPEFVTRLASSFGTTLDPAPSSRWAATPRSRRRSPSGR
jgi:phosphomannomutase